jgi:hypothetical protein
LIVEVTQHIKTAGFGRHDGQMAGIKGAAACTKSIDEVDAAGARRVLALGSIPCPVEAEGLIDAVDVQHGCRRQAMISCGRRDAWRASAGCRVEGDGVPSPARRRSIAAPCQAWEVAKDGGKDLVRKVVDRQRGIIFDQRGRGEITMASPAPVVDGTRDHQTQVCPFSGARVMDDRRQQSLLHRLSFFACIFLSK